MTIQEIKKLAPSHIIISPGLGRPEGTGVSISIVKVLGSPIPILEVCLGHQAICMAHRATITYAQKLMHGKQSIVTFNIACPLFKGLPNSGSVTRYHSLAVDPTTIPPCLEITARTADGEVMAVQHKSYPIYGLQFHPESIMTFNGKMILCNFMKEPQNDQ